MLYPNTSRGGTQGNEREVFYHGAQAWKRDEKAHLVFYDTGVALVAIIIGFFLIDGIVSNNNNAKRTKQLLIDQTVQSYKRMGENFQSMNFSLDILKQFNPDIISRMFKGDTAAAYGLISSVSMIATPAEYVGVIMDGKEVYYVTKSRVKVDPKELIVNPPASSYKILNSFGNLKGTLVDVFYPVDLAKVGLKGKFTVSTMFDLSKQVKEIDRYWNDQKRNTVIMLVVTGLFAFILFGLLSTFWLRYLVNKYIRKPVEDLNTTASEIAAGTFQGEVVVDPDSDFAALQGLLKSGQLILCRFDEKMDEKI